MNAELKAKWVAALRSGEYAQGKNGLRNQLDKFCCLGVLADVKDSSAWVPDLNVYSYDGFNGYLSDKTLPDEIQFKLAELNDDEGKSFAEIADYIEANITTEEA